MTSTQATSQNSSPGRSLSPRRRVAFAAIAIGLTFAAVATLLIAVDVYLHHKYERTSSLNVWGYRGPTIPRKVPGEYRIAVLGGSSAFGYGTSWDEAIPAVLERNLAARRDAPFSSARVVNLAYNNEGAYSFKFTLRDYLWLDYDLAVLYEGYNDLMADPGRPNVSIYRHDSAVFRLTGYLPISPLIFREKATALLYAGDVNAMYPFGDKRTRFEPGFGARRAADVLRAAAQVEESLERQIQTVSAEPLHKIGDGADTGCQSPWGYYCRSIADAVDFALARGKDVLVVTQPFGHALHFRTRHIDQQTNMAGMLERRYAAEPRVRYLNLGYSVDLGDGRLSYDGMHLTAAGNQIIGSELTTPVLEMAAMRK